MLAVIVLLAVYSCWKMVPPAVLLQPGAKFSPTRVAPPVVLFAPAVTDLAAWPQTALLYPVAKEMALGSVSSPPFRTYTCGLVTPSDERHVRKLVPMSSPTFYAT